MPSCDRTESAPGRRAGCRFGRRVFPPRRADGAKDRRLADLAAALAFAPHDRRFVDFRVNGRRNSQGNRGPGAPTLPPHTRCSRDPTVQDRHRQRWVWMPADQARTSQGAIHVDDDAGVEVSRVRVIQRRIPGGATPRRHEAEQHRRFPAAEIDPDGDLDTLPERPVEDRHLRRITERHSRQRDHEVVRLPSP